MDSVMAKTSSNPGGGTDGTKANLSSAIVGAEVKHSVIPNALH